MPNTRTSDEISAAPLDGSELVRIVQAGGNAKTTTGAIAGLSYQTPTTTRGDIIVRNSTQDVRLPIGANGTQLTADSGQPDGLKWYDGIGALSIQLASSTGGTLIGYQGAVGRLRTAQDKMGDWLSINDTTSIDPTGAADCTSAVIAAFAYAYSNGLPLYCPGTYKTSATIPHFHDVVKVGLGKFTRGSNTFWVSPLSSQTNNIYVATTGVDTQDGLSSTEPVLTLQQLVNDIASYGPYLNGTWVGNLAAGTYTNGATIPSGLQSLNYIHIAGPTGALPFIPTAIIDGTSATTTFAFNQAGNSQLYFTDLYFKNWATGKFGVVAQLFSTTYLKNCYSFNCDQPCKVQQGRMLIEGGVFVAGSNGSQGFIGISGETHSVGYNGSIFQGVTNNVTGASGTGTTATITFAALGSAPVVGSTVCVAGMTPSAYNGVAVITASSTTSLSYASTATGAMTVAGQFGYNYGCTSVGPLVYGFAQTNMLFQENATGHVDFTASEGSAICCDIVANSRVNANSSGFTGATGQGVRYRDSQWVKNNCVFSRNVLDEQAGAFAMELGRAGSWTSELRQPTDQVSVANTGNTTANTLKTYASAIKANSFNSSIKSYRGELFGTKTGTAGTATIVVTVGGTTVCTYTLPAAATQWGIEFLFAARNATSQRIRCKAWADTTFLGVQTGSGALSVITGSDLAMVITCQNANAGDTVTLLEVDQWNAGGC